MISGVQSSLKQRTVVVIGNGMVGQRFCEQLSRIRQAPRMENRHVLRRTAGSL